MRAQRFEDLVAWQKSRELARGIYEVTRTGSFARDFGLSGQIQRAVVSIMSNIAEAFERESHGEFHQFLVIARGSCAEIQSQLYLALDIGYLAQPEFDRLMRQAAEISNLLGALRASVAKSRDNQR